MSTALRTNPQSRPVDGSGKSNTWLWRPSPATITVLAVLIVGGVGHRWVNALLVAVDSAPAPLRAPLSSIPTVIGLWEGIEIPMDSRVLEVAGTDDHVYRRYVNRETNEVADVYIAYAARPVKLLSHRPQVCYPAHGWTPAAQAKSTVATADGAEFPCLIHRFFRSTHGEEEVMVLNYYILRGRHVTDWTEFWGPTWRLPNLSRDPSFYVAQVQISAATGRGLVSRNSEKTLRDLAVHIDNLLQSLLQPVEVSTPSALGGKHSS